MKKYLKSVVLIADKILTTKDISVRLQNYNKINEEIVTDRVYDIDYMDMHMRLHVSDTSPLSNKVTCRTLYYLERTSFWAYGFKVERTPLYYGELSVIGQPVARWRQAGIYSADYATFVSYDQHKLHDLVSDLTILLVS